MEVAELEAVVAALRDEGSDVADVEVKLAAGGFPQSIAPTLSAFGNTPGGGTLLFGLDEAAGFAPTGVYDVAACKAALASASRQAVVPPVTFDVQDFHFEGAMVVAATVHELPPSGKPCRVTATRKAYLRAYDGDYELSQVEEQAFLAHRSTPTFDRDSVAGTSTSDLNSELLAAYLGSCRSASSALAALSDAELLFRTGVTSGPDGTLTVAGLLAVGIYPQQHLPNCVIQASVAPRPSDPVGTRAADAHRFDGPIPTMLDEALRWVARNTGTRVRFGPSGHGRDEPEFPTEAVRELLSNTLIHRDLGPYALTEAVTLTLDDQRLILSNPGGLWGLTVDRLGQLGVSSARNGQLLRICQNVRTREGNRVVEALATGIPTVLAALRAAGLAPPHFYDQGIRFTVRVPNHALLAAEDLQWLAGLALNGPLDDRQRYALVGMRHGRTWTNQSLRATFPMDSRDALRTLTGLVDAGAATADGERRVRTYRLHNRLTESTAHREKDRAADSPAAPGPIRRGAGALARNTALVESQLSSGSRTAAQLRAATGLSPRQLDYALTELRSRGRVVLHGRRGIRSSSYQLLTPSFSQKPDS